MVSGQLNQIKLHYVLGSPFSRNDHLVRVVYFSMANPKKKQKRTVSDSNSGSLFCFAGYSFSEFSAASPSTLTLTCLPLELLSEVLLYTCSPSTVLSVSRTCSYLYRTLVLNPTASFIWRGVRTTCKPRPLPAPTSAWKGTEAEYAAFIFSKGLCEICKKEISLYVSFAARVRVCNSVSLSTQLGSRR